MKHNKNTIEELYKNSLRNAQMGLSGLAIAKGRKPYVIGLSGWVYEQTIRACLEDELTAMSISIPMEEQVSLQGRVKIDLRVGAAAIEIKVGGFIGAKGAEKYREYRRKIEAKGWVYFYLTRKESYGPYCELSHDIFGTDRAFFMDQENNWVRFVEAIAGVVQKRI
jgi:hypothetical protein